MINNRRVFYIALDDAFRMIFAGDSSIHSTKFGGLLLIRLFPLLFDMDLVTYVHIGIKV